MEFQYEMSEFPETSIFGDVKGTIKLNWGRIISWCYNCWKKKLGRCILSSILFRARGVFSIFYDENVY